MKNTSFFLVALLGLAACNEVPETGAAGTATRDTLAAAETQFAETVFDTIQWPSDSAAAERGAVVWKVGCAQCHGLEGRGDAGFVNEQGDTLRPPSFIAPDWQLAQNPREIRRKVYVGNAQGMPHWGLRRMAPRDIDAVTEYITMRLRPRKG
jgi:mono/diheme cytochrome c family protein